MRIGVVGHLEQDMFGANLLKAVDDAGHVAESLGWAMPQRGAHRVHDHEAGGDDRREERTIEITAAPHQRLLVTKQRRHAANFAVCCALPIGWKK